MPDNRNGFNLNDDEGSFGDSTEEAVRQCQNDNELDVTGVAGANTLLALGLDHQRPPDEDSVIRDHRRRPGETSVIRDHRRSRHSKSTPEQSSEAGSCK
jgi:hypothetical protein